MKARHVLVAPLNWGLGHATRCIPIINALLAQGAKVSLASDGRAYDLLQKEYPKLTIYRLPAYNIHYKGRSMLAAIGRQIPAIMRAIWLEHKAIQELVDAHEIDIIVSDNRYGCYHKATKNIFITHQLHIKIPGRPLQWTVNKVARQLIKYFDYCWVPDHENEPNLSGELGHPPIHNQIQYIGPLSRMRYKKMSIQYDLVAVLSGPEPQRSYLEKAIIKQATAWSGKVLIVQGKTEEEKNIRLSENLYLQSFLTSAALNDVILSSAVVLCRSGYSSIMDLAQLGAKAILIPTPGQTEQEYLALRCAQNQFSITQHQDLLDLKLAMQQVEHCKGFPKGEGEEGLLKTALQSILNKDISSS